MYDARSANRSAAAVWLPVLLGLGVALSAGLIAIVVLVVARVVPPYAHRLAGLLRTGRPIAVVFDPADPRTVMIDWPRAEREAT